MNDVPESIIIKITKLFELSKSPNENEASVALSKAHDLLKNYNLKMSDISITLTKEDIDNQVKEEVLGSGMFRDWEKILYRKIASLNFCKLILYSAYRGKSLVVIGKEHNILATKLFIEYIKGSIDRLAHTQYGKGKEYIASYKLALAIRLGERIEAMTYADLNCECKDLVVNEQANNDKFIKEKFGDLFVKKITMVSSSHEGYSKGYKDGDSISLNKQIATNGSNVARQRLTV